jgi:hypothetical protein
MDDEAYVQQLFEILTNPSPTGIDPGDPYGQADDGIDRYDGFGTDVRVTSARVVRGEHAPLMEIGFVLDLPADPDLAGVPETGSFLLAVDAEWRRLSGYDEPADYAPYVAHRVVMQVHRHVRAHRPPATQRHGLPGPAERWRVLLDGLGGEGRVREVAPGQLELSLVRGEEEPAVVTVLVTPEQWERVVQRHGVDLAPYDYFADLLGPLQDDECFVVFWEDDLVGSARAELPPVRGTAAGLRIDAALAAARAKDPHATFGWYAIKPRTPAGGD